MSDQKLLDHLIQFISEERNAKFDHILKERTRHFMVAVEDVYQLHNTSAVIRSCDVFGIQEVNIIEERNSKRIDREIAMGAQKWVDINRFNTSRECITEIKKRGYNIIATSPHKDDCTLENFDFTQKACFFLGSETKGLSDEVMDAADGYLSIPMVGFTESLNISVSAAIILHSVTSKLRLSKLDYFLSENDMISTKIRWIKKTLKSFDKIVERYKLMS